MININPIREKHFLVILLRAERSSVASFSQDNLFSFKIIQHLVETFIQSINRCSPELLVVTYFTFAAQKENKNWMTKLNSFRLLNGIGSDDALSGRTYHCDGLGSCHQKQRPIVQQFLFKNLARLWTHFFLSANSGSTYIICFLCMKKN